MARKKSAAVEDRIIDATLALAETKSWRSLTLGDIAAAASLSLAETMAAFPSKTAVLSAFSRRIDAETLKLLSEEDAADGTATSRDRLFDTIMLRFDAMTPYRAALNAIATERTLQIALQTRAQRGQASALTPHPLEAARLLNTDTASVQAQRLQAAQQLAERFNCVVVLKGSGSVIASPGQTPHLNPTGNARLASAGTGDVLAGMIGARWAAGGASSAFTAATEAVFAHGLAADRWPAHQPLTAGLLAQRAH